MEFFLILWIALDKGVLNVEFVIDIHYYTLALDLEFSLVFYAL